MNADITPDPSAPGVPSTPASDADNTGSTADAVTRETPVTDATASDATAPDTAVPAGPTGHDVPTAFTSSASAPEAPAPEAPAESAAPAPAAESAAPAASPVVTPAAPQTGAPVTPPSPYGHPGAAFGVPQPLAQPAPQNPALWATQGTDSNATQPTVPLDGLTGHTTPVQERKSRGGTRVAALVVAAALVGGVAGFGGSALWSAVGTPPSSGPASGPETVTVNNPSSVNETTAVAAKVLPSVVTIEVSDSKEGGSGSGVILSADGYVLTNTHVVTLGGAAASPTIRVTTSDGRIYDAEVVGTDPIYDLAVIKLKGASDLTPIEFADSSKLNVGSAAIAVGAPLGLSNSVTTGVISALNRSIQIASSAVPDTTTKGSTEQPTPDPNSQNPFQFDLPGTTQQTPKQTISIAVLQTDAAINHGNSGGALVDDKGRLIGINVAIASSGGSQDSGSIGLGFAIPSNIAQRVAKELIDNGVATHGLLGASVRDAAGVQGTDVAGAYIVDVVSGGPADGKLKADDIVTSLNGVPITSASDLTAQVRAAAAGSKATLTYDRGGKSHDIEVTLGALGS